MFENKSSEVEIVVDSIVRMASGWASRGRCLWMSLARYDSILAAISHGGTRLHAKVISSWVQPLMVV